jgi:DNA-binding transcriptional regulator YiaG
MTEDDLTKRHSECYHPNMKTKPRPLMSLAQFIKAHGSQEAAAREIGVSYTTVNRWINGHSHPDPLARGRLCEIGIDPDKI